MRILHFSTDDVTGGAAKAAYRLHDAFRRAGHESAMLVRRRRSADPDVHAVPRSRVRSLWRRIRRRLPGQAATAAPGLFNFDRDAGLDLAATAARWAAWPDLVCLHWVSDYLTARQIHRLHRTFDRPLLWVMMDQEPVTGGCHYSGGCERFRQACGACPLLAGQAEHDRSRVVWEHKRRWLTPLPLTMVAPTDWAAQKIRNSSLFGTHQIAAVPLAVDTEIYRPAPDRRAVRQALNLPLDKRIVFFGASDLSEARKGGRELVAALQTLKAELEIKHSGLKQDDLYLLAAGVGGDEVLTEVGLPGRSLGYIADERQLAAAYQAADVFVCPSIEDAGPMMIAEAMLCGTPVVAFNCGGAPALIDAETGYLAAWKDTADLARGLRQLLGDSRLSQMGAAAHRRALERHDPARVVARFVELGTRLSHSQKLVA